MGLKGKHLPSSRWLIGQRPLPGHREEPKFFFAWGLNSLSLQDLVTLAHCRWVTERFYQDAKGELGLDDYEGWFGLHRNVAGDVCSLLSGLAPEQYDLCTFLK